MEDKPRSEPATKTDLDAVKTELQSDINQLDGVVKNISGEILKINFRLDSIDDHLKTKVATKDDFNRLYNMMDSIAGYVKNYQRQDTLRGDAVMTHDDLLKNHEKRLTLIENSK